MRTSRLCQTYLAFARFVKTWTSMQVFCMVDCMVDRYIDAFRDDLVRDSWA